MCHFGLVDTWAGTYNNPLRVPQTDPLLMSHLHSVTDLRLVGFKARGAIWCHTHAVGQDWLLSKGEGFVIGKTKGGNREGMDMINPVTVTCGKRKMW